MPNQDEWGFHIWQTIPATKGMKEVRKYIGFFRTDKEALAWKRKQDNPEQYRITNYGPLALAKAANKSGLPTPSSARTGTATKAMADARAEANRRENERIAARKEQEAERQRVKAENDAEMADIRGDAAGLVDQHKQDEAADLAQGINR